MKNFVCYRGNVPTLELEGVHVACLCGDNGHGKSALLDAITWNLWGTARGRLQEELVYQGEGEMQVELEFLAGEERYRVARRYARSTRGRQGTTFLELLLSTDNGFKPISGNSVRETEAKIRSLLHMDYNTFVNSAFILQGRADMFTTSKPAERKEILGQILDLSWYNRVAERARARVRERERTVTNLDAEIRAIDQELSHREEYEARLRGVQEEVHPLETEVKSQEGQLEELQRENQRLQSLQQELGRLEREEKHILCEIKERGAHAGQYRSRIDELKARAGRLLALETDLAEVRCNLEALAVPSEDSARQRSYLQELVAQIHHLRQANATMKQEMEDLRVKVNLLQEAGASAKCPLCNHELGDEGCQHLAASYEAEGRQKADTYRGNEAYIRQMESEKDRLEKEVSQWEEEERLRRQRVQERHYRLLREVEEAKAAGEMVSQLIQSLESEEKLLETTRIRLREAQEAMPLLKKAASSLTEVLNASQGVKSLLENLRTRQRGLLQELGEVQGRLERCRQLELQRQGKSDVLSAASSEQGIYDQLSVAFGKSGIQALLIEQAMPELEDRANDILGRITDYRMSIKLQTQRERRAGGDPIETLDIRIADELGTRSYEMYSGGEAFRINFALRIALSRLLAHRSGAPLPTLFIDEGFGTQDTSGRERLIEAIKTIQNDFQKIIVITHIEELKDAFPVRIEVTKTPQGSTFWMS